MYTDQQLLGKKKLKKNISRLTTKICFKKEKKAVTKGNSLCRDQLRKAVISAGSKWFEFSANWKNGPHISLNLLENSCNTSLNFSSFRMWKISLSQWM